MTADLLLWMRTVLASLEFENAVRPHRRFGHLIDQGRVLLARLEQEDVSG